MTSLTGRWSRALQRAATVSFMSTLAVLVFAGPAAATTKAVHLHEPHKGTVAADFENHECPDDQLPQRVGEDGWHFVAPGKTDFVSLTLTYEDSAGAPQVVELAEGDFGPPDAKHANVYTPAGWTLLDGTGTVEGDSQKDAFVLSHTCPASSKSSSPSPSDSESPTDVPTDVPASGLPSVLPSEQPSEQPSEAPSASQSAPAPGNGGGLPVTGLALTGVILTGLGMVGAGVAMRALRRRGDAEDGSGEEPTDV